MVAIYSVAYKAWAGCLKAGTSSEKRGLWIGETPPCRTLFFSLADRTGTCPLESPGLVRMR